MKWLFSECGTCMCSEGWGRVWGVEGCGVWKGVGVWKGWGVEGGGEGCGGGEGGGGVEGGGVTHRLYSQL